MLLDSSIVRQPDRKRDKLTTQNVRTLCFRKHAGYLYGGKIAIKWHAVCKYPLGGSLRPADNYMFDL